MRCLGCIAVALTYKVEPLASISSSCPCLTVPWVVQAPGRAAGKGFKAAREAERRASSGNRAAWSTLFMRPDTVAAAVAEHYGVSRADLLDREASGVALSSGLHTVTAILQGHSQPVSAALRVINRGVSVAAYERLLNDHTCVL